MKRRWITLWIVLLLVLGGCHPTAAPSSDKLTVTVSIIPQQYFVERIGGTRVTVNVMVMPGASPATYEPRAEQLAALSNSAAYFSIGVPFEDAWLEKIAAANPKMLLVDTTQGIRRMDHDPHIWLSPRLVKIQARTIAQALSQLDPAHQAEYQVNLDAFLSEIDTLDAELRQTLSDVPQRKFMVFHPSWGYFARDYGLEQIPVEVGGQEPSAAELAALIQQAQANDIHVIFAQPEFSTRAAQTIANEIGGQVVLISPLALDWPANLRRVAQAIASANGE